MTLRRTRRSAAIAGRRLFPTLGTYRRPRGVVSAGGKRPTDPEQDQPVTTTAEFRAYNEWRDKLGLNEVSWEEYRRAAGAAAQARQEGSVWDTFIDAGGKLDHNDGTGG